MRRNDQNEGYSTHNFRPDTNIVSPLSATWQQSDRQDIPLDGRVSGNGRNGQVTSVPPFDWYASEALMKCYNG